MARSSRYGISAMVVTVLATAASIAAVSGPLSAQAPIDVFDLADYRLTPQVFDQFVRASRRISEITRNDTVFTFAPLFTKEFALDGDAVEVASALSARLENHAGLSAALEATKLTPREYSKFAISLLAAHLAHGFMKAGVLQRVPSGAPTNNVEFVKTHETEVDDVLAELGIRD